MHVFHAMTVDGWDTPSHDAVELLSGP